MGIHTMHAKNSTGDDTPSIVMAAEKLVAAITFDDSSSGGLISRATSGRRTAAGHPLRYHARRSA